MPQREAASLGPELAKIINCRWRELIAREYGVDSFLELQFESHFSRFFMPKIRGQDVGSKKRYAGMLVGDGDSQAPDSKIIFRGLEAVRSDWTLLAREFQKELFGRIFNGLDVEDYVRSTVSALRAGRLDHTLVYKKRLRQSLDAYDSITPPHVHSARLLAQRGVPVRKGDIIEYVFTVCGAMPASGFDQPLDYDHYIRRQMSPAVDGLLELIGTSVGEVIDRQIRLL
jgi:DNA polymerase-2